MDEILDSDDELEFFEFDRELNDLIDKEIEAKLNSIKYEEEEPDTNNNLDDIINIEIDRILNLTLNEQINENEENRNADSFQYNNEQDQYDSFDFDESLDNRQKEFPVIEIVEDDPIENNELGLTFECSLCLEELSINLSERLKCLHTFCQQCLSSFLVSKINDGQVLDIKCPEHGCNLKVEQTLIRILLPKELLPKYESFYVKKIVDNLDDVMNCPECNKPVECDLGECNGLCFNCNYAFCTSCKKDYHGAENCEDLRKRLEENEKSEQLIRENFKQCPGCRTNIEKDIIGCNHMTCAKCSTQFCWLCMDVITNVETHYNRDCVLFQHDFVD